MAKMQPHDALALADNADAILALPPPPSYDVFVDSLSVAVPPHKAYIPTPIPIPIPQVVSDTFKRLGSRKANVNAPQLEVNDGLIVRDVNATVRRGEMMAIIGGSGSGKTTLLHAIASRLGNLPIARGSVQITPSTVHASRPGIVGDAKGANKVLGFVRQHDYLLPHLTVRETLTYAAQLRLPSTIDVRTRKLIVEQTIHELGLIEASDTIVGGAGRKGISGGEKRRLTIGCVLVSFPSVLVLDEPTTGLDSFTAYQLLETLGRLAKHGRTIILSLHQPRSDAYALFSRLLLLSHGSVVYSGETRACLPHFAGLGHEPEVQTNPLDFLIDVSSIDTRDEDEEKASRERVGNLTRRWKEQEASIRLKQGLVDKADGVTRSISESHPAISEIPDTMDTKRPNVFQQTAILFPRAVQNMYRGYPELIGHFTQAWVLGLLVGIVFFQLKGEPNDIQSLKFVVFANLPLFSYMSQVVWTFRWSVVLIVFDREREDELYAPSSWLFSEFLAWLPVNIIGPAIYSVMVYFICNLRQDDLSYNCGVFIASIILVHISFVVWSIFATSIERSFAKASLLGNAISIFFIMTPGFLLVHVPGWIHWFRWLSPYFYAFRIGIITQFRDRQFSCEDVPGPLLSGCSGDNILRSLNISPAEPIYPLFLGLLGFILVTTALSLFLLTVWKPGGVRHAQRVTSDPKGKEHTEPEMDLISTRINVRAENVQLYHVRRQLPGLAKVKTPILTKINANFPAGEVSAIMGPSGSGKSTFLRMMASRQMQGGLLSSFEPSGEIMFNGTLATSRTRHLCAFMEQEDDYHMPALTVRETLRYAAILKLPTSVSRKRKLARAEEVLKMLGLRDCADVIVGSELLKGISGGEKRRLSLACQLINDPPVLLVDEPTSGLDANTARNVMEALRDIARSGRAVIVSLHQPRSDIYNMIDNFLVLAKRGNVVFQGPRQELLANFALAGHVCPPLYNPSDYCLDLISVDVRGKDNMLRTTERLNALIEHWRKYEEKAAAIAEAEPSKETAADPTFERQLERTPIYIALPVVLERSFKNAWRQQDIFWTRLIQAPIFALCLFVFFLRLSHGPSGAQDRIGLIAESTVAITFIGLLNLIALYPMEKAVFFHDYKSAGGGYSTTTFLVSFSLFAIVPEVLGALLYAVIINVATGMRTNGKIFFEFAIGIWAQLSCGESIGIVFASFFDTMGLSVSLVSVLLSIGAQSSSVYSASIVKWLGDIAWIFPMKYASHIMLINEMRGMTFNCSPESIASGECVAETGEQVLQVFGMQGESPWLLTVVMVLVTFAYRLAAWLLLTMRMRYL